MTRMILSALAAGIFAAAPAVAQYQETFPSTPMMQLTGLTGEISIQAPGQVETVSGQKLPYIRSGSVIRVLSGRAEFETDYHAIVRAKKGDGFRFTASAPSGSRPGFVRIASLAKGDPASEGSRPGAVRGTPAPRGASSLNVHVGSARFNLLNDGAVTIAGTAPGESTVRAEGGTLRRPTVEVVRAGAMSTPQEMMPNQPLLVSVPENEEFENDPASLAMLSVDRKNATTFEVRARHPEGNAQVSKADRVDEIVSKWPTLSRMTAELAMNRYGLPDKVSSDMISWSNSGPWQKTVVYRTGPRHGFPQRHDDVIKQSVSRVVPTDKAAQLAKMDIGLSVDADNTVLSASSDSEESNFLAVNLADEVIRGERTPEDARNFYTKTIELSAQGKSSRYTQEIIFQEPR